MSYPTGSGGDADKKDACSGNFQCYLFNNYPSCYQGGDGSWNAPSTGSGAQDGNPAGAPASQTSSAAATMATPTSLGGLDAWANRHPVELALLGVVLALAFGVGEGRASGSLASVHDASRI